MVEQKIKPFKILTKDYFIGNLGCPEATDEINLICNNQLQNDENVISKYDSISTIRNGEVNYKLRKCFVSSIPVDNLNFIEQGLKKTIEYVNDMQWKMDLSHRWESNIQYTKYLGKGHFYDWHPDVFPKEHFPNHSAIRRKISIVYCLSDKSDYVGGEFQIKTDDGIYTRKFGYGDFIVFPSEKIHRVKPLKSGTRITLVGWYT